MSGGTKYHKTQYPSYSIYSDGLPTRNPSPDCNLGISIIVLRGTVNQRKIDLGKLKSQMLIYDVARLSILTPKI